MKQWLIRLAMHLASWEAADERRPARERIRFARWFRVLERKHDTGRGVILVDREGVAYNPSRRVVLKAK